MSRSANLGAVLALACLVVSATAAAQQPRVRLGIGAGVTAPQGEFHADDTGEGFNSGWQGIAFLEFGRPQGRLSLRVDLFGGENPANDQLNADVSALAGQPVTAKIKLRGGNFDLVYHLGRSRRGAGGYLLGGIGSTRVTAEVKAGGVSSDTSESKFAWNAGGGITFPVGRAGLFVEARYCSVETTFDNSGKLPFVGVTAGVRLGGK